MKKILIVLISLFIISFVTDNYAQSNSECFVQPNGDTVCYDKTTGRRYVLRRV